MIGTSIKGKFFSAAVVLLIFSFSPYFISTSNLNGKKMTDLNYEFSNLFNLNSQDKDWIESTLDKMTLREKCAQMIMPWALGEYLPQDSTEYQRLVHLVKDLKVGGLIFFRGNILNEAMLIKKMQQLSDVPLLVASDFERGLAMRLTDAIEFPYNMALAATGEPELAYKMGKDVSIECRALGVNQNYAPVADINNNPDNPIINIRAYSEDKNIVSEFCDAFIKGATEERVLTTLKHFPGHGDTKIDSHQEMPVIQGDSAYLADNELFPFKNAIKSGAHSVMVGHLDVPAFDTSSGIPATLSEPIITGLLKKKMGFQGLIATDALNMSAVTKYYSAADAAVMAVKAGNDLLLMPPDEDVAVNALVNAVEDGEISIDRINYSVRKILAAKRWVKAGSHGIPDLENLSQIINSAPHFRLAQEIADKSVTLVKNKKGTVPVNSLKIQNAACITITDGMESENDLLFQRLADENFTRVKKIILNKKSRPRDYARAYLAARESDLVLLASFVKVRAYQGTVNLSKKNTDFIKKVIRLKTPSVLISFGNPYLLSIFPAAKTYICAYGDPPVSQRAVMKAILGEIAVTGKLPISIPDTPFGIGYGLRIEKTEADIQSAAE